MEGTKLAMPRILTTHRILSRKTKLLRIYWNSKPLSKAKLSQIHLLANSQ